MANHETGQERHEALSAILSSVSAVVQAGEETGETATPAVDLSDDVLSRAEEIYNTMNISKRVSKPNVAI